MRTLKLALAAAAASLCFAGAAQAQEDTGPSFAFNIGAASEYVFRGISQTDEDPQVFGGVDATIGMGYAGVWVRTSTSATAPTLNTTCTLGSSRPLARSPSTWA